MNKIILTAFFVSIIGIISADFISLEISAGNRFGDYAPLENILNETASDLQHFILNAKVTDNFDKAISYTVHASSDIGLKYITVYGFNYFSSAGRIAYEDYSGFLRHDILMESISIDLGFRIIKHQFSKFSLNGDIFATYHLNNFEFKEDIEAGTFQKKNSTKFSSRSFGVKFAFSPKYNLYRSIYVFGSASYAVTIDSDLVLKDYEDVHLLDEQNKKVNINLNSGKMMIGFGVNFGS